MASNDQGEVAALKAKVSNMLRACLTSSKEGVLLSHVNNDYNLVTGKPIPYREMGFRSLEDFIRSIPDHVTVSRNRDGGLLCKAVLHSSSSHVARLVAGQKSSNKKSASKKGSTRFYKVRENMGHPRRTPSQPNNYRNPHNRSEVRGAAALSPPVEKKRAPTQRKNVPPRFQKLRQPQSISESPLYEFQGQPFREPSPYGHEPPPYEFRQPVPSPPLQQRPVCKTYKEMVENYCHDFNVNTTPIFKTVPGPPNVFYCTLQIGDNKYSTYPEEYCDAETAIEGAAKKAVDDLKIVDGTSAYPVTQSRNVYLSRLEQLVEHHTNGLWIKAVEDMYKDTYQEMLPKNWFDFAETANLKLEKISNIGKILYPHKKKPKCRIPERLTPPASECWDVYVCYFGNSADLALRLIEDKIEQPFEVMSRKLYERYSESKPELINVELQNTYAAQTKDGWFRVVAQAVVGGEVQCDLIDVGDKDNVSVRDLRTLDDQFFDLPSQALRANLSSGLEFLRGIPELNERWRKHILDRTFVGCVVDRDEENAIYTLTLYDTSSEEDVNVNDHLIDDYLGLMEPPMLPDMHEVCEAYLCHISPTGDTYIQLCNPTFDVLFSLLETCQMQVKELPECQKLETDKVYLVKCSTDSHYYRARYTGVKHNFTYEVFFIDLGDKEFVCRDVIKDPDALPERKFFSNIPEQAIHCKLYLVDNYVCEVRARLLELVPPDTRVLVRVCKPQDDSDDLKEVDLFSRKDGCLVSIPVTISQEYTQCSEDSNNNLDNVKKSSGRGSLKEDSSRVSSPESLNSSSVSYEDSSPLTSLTPPPETSISPDPLNPVPIHEIPSKEKHFDVKVALAANPGNFWVQSYNEQEKLCSLMHQMTEYYSATNNQTDATPDYIEEGGYYATLHTDGSWYRIQIKIKLDEDTFSAFFIDYGDLNVITRQSILHLHQQFRPFRAQALKAKLSDIKPIHGDWTPDDVLQFCNLVVNKDFVSFVKDSSTGEDGSPLLNLILIDTSAPENDVYIHKEMVEEGRASYS